MTSPSIGQFNSTTVVNTVSGGASVPLTFGVFIQSIAANTGKVYIGTTNAVNTSVGYEIAANTEKFFSVREFSDLNAMYIVANTNTQDIRYRAF